MSLRCVALSCALSVAGVGLGASSAHATFPGTNGAIAYSEWEYDTGGATDGVGLSTLRSISPDGSRDRLLYRDPEYSMGEPAWSPDGTRLAWSAYGFGGKFDGIYVDTIEFTKLKLVAKAKFPEAPAWSPDGSTIIYADYPQGLFTVPATGAGDPTPLLASPKRWALATPVYAPDGRSVVFGRATTSTKASKYRGEIWTANADGTAARPLLGGTGGLKLAAWPDISPDGTQLVFNTYRSATVRSALYVSAIDGSGLRKLATAPGSTSFAGAVWSPDGTKLVVSRIQSSPKRGSALLTVDVASGTQTLLRRVKRGFLTSPDWQAIPAPK